MKKIIIMFFFLIVYLSLNAQEYHEFSNSQNFVLRKNSPDISTKVTFENLSDNGKIFKAGQKGKFTFYVTNSNDYDLFNVSVSVSSMLDNYILYEKSNVVIGDLIAKRTQIIEFNLSSNNYMPTTNSIVNFVVRENATDFNKTTEFRLNTSESLVADVILDGYEIIDSNSDGLLEPGEKMDVNLKFKNTGRGYAYNVLVRSYLEENGVQEPGSMKEINLGNLPPGISQTANFNFFPTNNSVDLKIMVLENDNKLLFEKKINIKNEFHDELADNLPHTGKVNLNAIAVIIANREYSHKDIPKVDYAIRDARLVKEYLKYVLGYSEIETNITQATFNKIFGTRTDHRGQLFNFVKPKETDVFIYYCGHGAPDVGSNEGYFVPVDSDPSSIRFNGYSLNDFYNNLSKIEYKTLTVVIDACFSGFSENGTLIKDASPLTMKVKDPTLLLNNAAIFASASGEEISSWYPEKKHSLFTYYFLKAIQQGQDFIGSDYLKLGDMKKYLQENVKQMARRLKGRDQNPQITGDNEMVIVHY